MDIVVLHSTDFEETLLPAGRLRESLSSLHRASAIVLRAEDRALEAELRKRGVVPQVWIQHRRLAVENGTRAVAFCGIARPEEFFAALAAQGVELVATLSLRDHQHYSNAELDRLAAAVCESGAECLITTEKDAARLTREQRERLEKAAPLRVARLDVSLEDEAATMRRLLDLL
jgi:tetraacyldisaccharide 4'-kinase